jgi:hypothetical protein
MGALGAIYLHFKFLAQYQERSVFWLLTGPYWTDNRIHLGTCGILVSCGDFRGGANIERSNPNY